MATLVGIDLGAHTVKVAVMEGRLGKVQLKDYRVRALAHGEEEPGEAAIAALSGLLGELGLEDTVTYAIGAPGQNVSVRSVSLPFAAADRIQKTLAFELEGYVPFDLDDFVLDHRIHPNERGARVLCGLAPKDGIRALLGRLAAVGVDPKHVVLDADVLGTFADRDGGVQAIVDIGHDRTLVAITRGNEHLTVRTLSVGGRALTQALVDELDLEWRDAEGAKHAASLGSAPLAVAEWEEDEQTQPGMLRQKDAAGVDTVLKAALGPLFAQLRSTLIAAEDELGHGIDEVLLTGGTASLEGLSGLLADNLGVPVRRVDVSPEADDLGDAGRFALAHALALRAAGMTGGQEIQFRHGEFAYKGDIAMLRTALGFGLVAALMFCVVGTGLFALRTVQYQSEIGAVEEQIAASLLETFPDVSEDKANDPTMARAIMLEKTTEVVEKVDALGATVGGEPPTLVTLKEISEALPKADEAKVDVKELTISNTGVSMKAETTGYEAAASIEAGLRDNTRFKSAKKADEKKLGDGISFSLSIPFEEEEAEEVDG